MARQGLSDISKIVAADVGGTNTDLFMIVDGKEYCHKLPSTKANPAIATVQGTLEICEQAGLEPELLERMLHGTTVATNAVIERKVSKVGMITTEGFRDLLAIGRHRKPYNFSIHQEVLQEKYPLVERRYIKTVRERMIAPGVVDVPLDFDQVKVRADELVADGVEAIAICFLFSFLNPEHEKQAEAIIRERHPDIPVARSSEVAPVFREWYRFSTTVISCSLMRVFSSYIRNLHQRMEQAGIKSEVLIVQSSGGMSTVEQAAAKPVNFLYSGPAGGVLEAKYVGDALGEKNVIGIDIGGTTADVVVIKDGRVPERDPRDSTVGGYPVMVPMLDIETIGTGGGSIAWVDDGGGFNVGPISAGAEPGPACYGRGGEDPTVTDAQLVLGRLNPASFLGGSYKIDRKFSERVISEKLCDRLNGAEFKDVPSAAMAILELANHKMAQAINNQTIRRGYDPREFALFPFGGAGPLHGCDLAEIIGSRKIIVPRWPGVGCARGFTTTDIKYSHAHTVNMLLDEVTDEDIDVVLQHHREQGMIELEKSRVPQKSKHFNAYLDCMYHGQGYELRIPFAGVGKGWKDAVKRAFLARHEEEYGHSKEASIKIVNIRLDAVGLVPMVPTANLASGSRDPSAALKVSEKVYFGTATELQRIEVPRYDYDRLKANNVIAGPAIVDEMDTTTVIKHGWQAQVTNHGYMLLTRQ